MLGYDQKNEMKIILQLEKQAYPVSSSFCDNKKELIDTTVDNLIEIVQQYFKLTTELNGSISNSTIEEAGNIFTWMVRCQQKNLGSIAWTKFYDDLFNDHTLRKSYKEYFCDNVKCY